MEAPTPAPGLALQLDCNQRAPAVAREALRSLEGIGWILGDAMLVTSELVTNAVLHSGCEATDVVEVTLSVRPDCLVVSVRDPARSGGSAVPAAEDNAFGGMGLRIVQQLCRAWGGRREDDGYRVWAEMALASPATDARSTDSSAVRPRSTPA